MEKDSGHFCYEPYPAVTKSNPSTTNSLRREKSSKPPQKAPETSCNCLGKKTKRKGRAFLTGFATNLGICIVLFGYTLLGSVIFLSIEGGHNYQHQILATTSLATPDTPNKSHVNETTELTSKNDKARSKTVENLWIITEGLNILYKENWTILAAQEITRFQNELLNSMKEEMTHQQPLMVSKERGRHSDNFEWTFAKAFLYSLTVLTTIGYGSIAPKTALGKAVTMGYAMLGIPLTLLYLSSVGSILSRVARGVFSRALCCCLCSNCGYCCYDEKRMAEKERRMKRKRQQLELQQQLGLQEPFYVRSNSSYSNNIHSPCRDSAGKEIDSLSGTDNESKSSIHGWSILAPILLCLVMMFIYICIGTFVLYKLENWSLLDGFYFCFMSLTTIGFGNMVPGSDPFPDYDSSTTLWFCSIYIMSGMALTAMSFNVVHDEIVHRLKHQQKSVPKLNSVSFSDDLNINDPYNLAS
ncbi:potassium channel subfamily K member 18 isoform X2 [Dendroctonus ponderosae]|uniref:potassium channel subfamily K member 18-like isoform X2 n=1 Tax=Dendroctonus ponderosae TaxID=77166 RepID=UPI0020362B75|nr:potassium channel subfamily K member 18-like isoform X2 [Dendroctonus ponderosae]XP_048521894.1 potassium channel subfamily K member 18 isoform X2 [Dendroctonus ponderosae]